MPGCDCGSTRSCLYVVFLSFVEDMWPFLSGRLANVSYRTGHSLFIVKIEVNGKFTVCLVDVEDEDHEWVIDGGSASGIEVGRVVQPLARGNEGLVSK